MLSAVEHENFFITPVPGFAFLTTIKGNEAIFERLFKYP